MPEVILPCPACGSRECESVVCTVSADEHQSLHYNVECCGCYMSGPVLDREADAIAAWNALPRAMTWTHEPPKVAGKYWWRDKRRPDESGIINVTETKLDGYRRNPIGKYGQWAGPIPAPID